MTDEATTDEDEARAVEAEMIALVGRARLGDHDALPRLRELAGRMPAVLLRYGDLARQAQRAWVELAAGATDLALGEALRRKVAALRAELAGSEISPPEALLVDRVVLTWLDVNHSDASAAAEARDPATTAQQAEFVQRRQERALRRHLAAVAALASTRKLLARLGPRADGARPIRPAPSAEAAGGRRAAPDRTPTAAGGRRAAPDRTPTAAAGPAVEGAATIPYPRGRGRRRAGRPAS